MSVEGEGGPGDGDAPPRSGMRAIRRTWEGALPALGFVADLLARVEIAEGTYALRHDTMDGRRVGEVLVIDGGIAAVSCATTRRAKGGGALGRIAEGLAGIARAAPSGLLETSMTASGRGFPVARRAFSPAEVYWRAAPLAAPPGEDAATRCFGALADGAPLALLLWRGDALTCGTLPIVARGLGCLEVNDALDLGRELDPLAEPGAPAPAPAGGEPGVISSASEEGALVGVRTAERIALVGGLDARAAARALAVARRIVEDESARPGGGSGVTLRTPLRGDA